ncbi:hypothetical protein [Cytobacillus pseudoceanisediminis]|uniref:hypothetical protein n=1 Tax=Cytobacillus pseudoceanisediminis TaxID=3051614 RepID=UPI003C2B34E5
MIIATVSSLNYLYRAEVLAKSVKKYHPEAKVFVCLLENKIHPDVMKIPFFDQVLLAKDLKIPNFNTLIFKYNAGEASWALKSKVLNYLYENEADHDQFLYFDSDIRLYSPLNEIKSILKKQSIVLTPHLVLKGPETKYLWHGIFNAGFVGISRTAEGHRFIKWWEYKVENYCYKDKDLLLYDDQGWLKLVPTYFNANILRHPGYNVSFWNFHERKLGRSDPVQQYTINDKYPLRFLHYSYLSTILKDCVESSSNNVLKTLYSKYLMELKQTKLFHLSKEAWSYNFFNNGLPINEMCRTEYRNSMKLQLKYPNPFILSPNFFKEGHSS